MLRAKGQQSQVLRMGICSKKILKVTVDPNPSPMLKKETCPDTFMRQKAVYYRILQQ
jgi:hypothetical protein